MYTVEIDYDEAENLVREFLIESIETEMAVDNNEELILALQTVVAYLSVPEVQE